MCGEAPPAAALTVRTQDNPSGACGANACHACTTCFATDQGPSIEYVDTLPTGWVRNTKRVTIPKFPPPPPRSAQYRSGCSCAFATTAVPSARTTVASSRWSLVSPNFLPDSPIPPPCVSPATPTVGHVPPGTMRPLLPSTVYTFISSAPAPAAARPFAASDTACRRETSTTTPWVVE